MSKTHNPEFSPPAGYGDPEAGGNPNQEVSTMTRVTVSFPLGSRTVSVERETTPGEEAKSALRTLLSELEEIAIPGKATPAQLRAFWAKAINQLGWDKEKVKSFLKERLGASNKSAIVGVIEKEKLSRLIDEINGNGNGDKVDSDKATAAQLRALWGKALGKGWDRERVKSFLEQKLSTSDEEEIVGKADRAVISCAIDEIELAEV
jgi:hypothetical protein